MFRLLVVAPYREGTGQAGATRVEPAVHPLPQCPVVRPTPRDTGLPGGSSEPALHMSRNFRRPVRSHLHWDCPETARTWTAPRPAAWSRSHVVGYLLQQASRGQGRQRQQQSHLPRPRVSLGTSLG
jgi:hypothetical protein